MIRSNRYIASRIPCDGGVVLPRVQVRHLVRAHQRLVHLRAVLHRAGAEAEVDVDVLAERLLREAQEVPQHRRLRQLRAAAGGTDRRSAAGHRGERVADRRRELGLGRRRDEAALARHSTARAAAARSRPPGGTCEGASWCSSDDLRERPSASRSMSAFVCTSVTQTSADCPSCRERARQVERAVHAGRGERAVDLGDRRAGAAEVDDELLEERRASARAPARPGSRPAAAPRTGCAAGSWYRARAARPARAAPGRRPRRSPTGSAWCR